MFLTGFRNVFNFMNDHSYFFVKEEGDNDKYNSNKRSGSSFRRMLFLPLSWSFIYCSMPGFASVLLWYVTIVWWVLICEDSLFHIHLFFPLRYHQFHSK